MPSSSSSSPPSASNPAPRRSADRVAGFPHTAQCRRAWNVPGPGLTGVTAGQPMKLILGEACRRKPFVGHSIGVALHGPEDLLGREPELALGRELLQGVRGGAAAVVMIEGEAGIGKTELVRHFTREAAAAGALVWRDEAHALERNRPFGALVDALDLRQGSADPRRANVGRLIMGDVGADSQVSAACLATSGSGSLRRSSPYWRRRAREPLSSLRSRISQPCVSPDRPFS